MHIVALHSNYMILKHNSDIVTGMSRILPCWDVYIVILEGNYFFWSHINMLHLLIYAYKITLSISGKGGTHAN
jgi:drug/metabolite transporter superfamily protein YnfA